jgi:predicted SAM-dependent methyltransferase
MPEIKLNIGCGGTRIPGFIGVDIIKTDAVDIIAPADLLPYKDNEVDEVVVEHMLEHLTYECAQRAVVEWHRILRPDGVLTIEVPDVLGLCKQFVEANHYNQYISYKGYWPISAHLYGHQRGSTDPEKISQIHKSGWTLDHLCFVLSGVGFESFAKEPPKKGVPGTCVLRLSARKAK